MVKHSLKRCVLLLVAGTALQVSIGNLDASFLSYPWGVLLAVNYLYVLIFLVAFADRWKWVRSLYDRAAGISSLAAMLVLTLLFGLIPQNQSPEGMMGILGFTQMTSSWIFNVFLCYWMTVMGLNAVEDVYRWKQRKLSTVVMHVAFFVVVASAVFGSGDKERIKVFAHEGRPMEVGLTQSGQPVRLPFRLTLKNFEKEVYPTGEPKSYLSTIEVMNADRQTTVDIRVNHPARVGVWRIYQMGYDSEGEQGSTVSILECVKDGWYTAIQICLWLILAAGSWMFLFGWKSRKRGKEAKR